MEYAVYGLSYNDSDKVALHGGNLTDCIGFAEGYTARGDFGGYDYIVVAKADQSEPVEWCRYADGSTDCHLD